MMKSNKKYHLAGLEKTAILFNVIGKEKAFEMMKGMKDSDVRRLLNVMGSMKKAPIPLINTVLREYLHKLNEKEEIIFEDNITSPELVSEGLGEERAKQIFGTTKGGVNLIQRRHLSVLETVDPKTLAEFLVDEHPQTIALVIAHMDLDKQLGMIRHFPESLRAEIVLRMSNLEYVSPEKVDELDEILKKELFSMGKVQRNQFGGVAAVADLVNNLDKKTMNSLMARIEDKDPILAEEIRQHMFTFTDIAKIDQRGIQLILREVPSDRLLLALKSAPEEILQKFLAAMSERAAAILREDLGDLGPQKVSEVEAAQRVIVTLVRRLEEEGKIVIGISEENELIP